MGTDFQDLYTCQMGLANLSRYLLVIAVSCTCGSGWDWKKQVAGRESHRSSLWGHRFFQCNCRILSELMCINDRGKVVKVRSIPLLTL